MLKFLIFLFVLPILCFCNYPAFHEQPVNKENLRYFPESPFPGAYLYPCMIKLIDKGQVSSILEVGSRDVRDAIDLSEYFKCHVFAFECNPQCIEICRYNSQQTPNVTLIEKAAWDCNGTISFFPVIPEIGKINDPGSSSCFKMTAKTLERYSQGQVTVQAIRLDSWLQGKDFKSFDLICMDTQGATLKILKGMGEYLNKTKYIITECEVSLIYEDECLLPELVSFLNSKGFEMIKTEMPYDYLFVNKRNLTPSNP